MSAMYLTAGTVVSRIAFMTFTTAASSVTGTWAGIFTLSGTTATLVAATAQQSLTSLAGSQAFSWPIAQIASGASSTYTVPTSGVYYVGICITATTMPTVVCTSLTSFNGISPYVAANATGSTNPPAIGTTYSATSAVTIPYYALT